MSDVRFTLTRETFVKWSEHVVNRAKTEAITDALSEVERRDAIRQALEDQRANKRNLNRMFMLVGALLIGIIVSYTLTHPTLLAHLGVPMHTTESLAPYAFVITILMDASLAVYAFIRKY